MFQKKKKIDTKIKNLGKILGLDSTETLRAKRTVKNIVTLALVTGAIILFGSILMPGGPVGLYYTGGSVNDFKMFFGGLL